MKKFIKTVPTVVVAATLLAACGDGEEDANADDVQEADGDTTEIEEEDESEAENVQEETAANEEGANEEGGNPDAVEPSDPNDSNTVDFQRINWMMGSPDREPEPGIWLYTADDHAEGDEDTYDFDEHDVLHYQTDDYMGHTLRAQQIILEDDDTAKIVVNIHSEPRDSDDEEDYEMPRQHLNVEKEELRDKNFIVETEEGETLNLE